MIPIGICKLTSSEEAIDQVLEMCRESHYTIGYTCGAFDILHAGHARLLAEAAELVDVLVVGVNTDESVRAYKSPDRPIQPWRQRAELVASLESVDFVVALPDPNPRRQLARWTPNLYIKGGDYQLAALEDEWPHVKVIPLHEGVSTTELIERIGREAYERGYRAGLKWAGGWL